MLLEDRGFQVTIAAGFQDAIQAVAGLQERRVDLVISDLRLPDGAGTDLMRRLRDLHGLRGIALSGLGPTADGHEESVGFVMHLTKPVDAHALEAAVRKCLG